MLTLLAILWLVALNITYTINNSKRLNRIDKKLKIIHHEQEKSESKKAEEEGSDHGRESSG